MEFIIVSGTEKAGTTSLYQYLLDSGFFNPSLKKETDYFRRDKVSLEGYLAQFYTDSSKELYLEASPGYLAESHISSKNIKKTVGECSLLVFLLRSPMARLISSFVFHKSRLFIPESMSFDSYIDLCFKFYSGYSSESLGLDEWFLNVPDAGRYFYHLKDFRDENLSKCKVFDFDLFNQDPKVVVDSIMDAVGLDIDFYNDYDFRVFNQTGSFKYKNLQKLALYFNKSFESFFFKYPEIKVFLLRIYRQINGGNKEVVVASDEVKFRLREYYKDDISSLVDCNYITQEVASKWMKDFD